MKQDTCCSYIIQHHDINSELSKKSRNLMIMRVEQNISNIRMKRYDYYQVLRKSFTSLRKSTTHWEQPTSAANASQFSTSVPKY
uniref:Uncharacterized protein n=1 Tax=Arundo donax TaxID=35708 RepID=A0A0A9GPF6_ARUDO